MSKSVKRSIIVNGDQYFWVIDGNEIYSVTHVRVHLEGSTGGILYIDPYNRDFEVRPKFIAQAIKYALGAGWDPVELKRKMYISYIDEKFCVLPTGIKYGYELNKGA